MAKKEFKVSTKRLFLKPLSQVAMGRLADETEDAMRKQAYLEMAEKAMEAEDPYWYCAWGIYEKKTGKLVGDFSFKGPEEYASVEIGCYIQPESRGKGYEGEALRAMMDTALYGDHGIYFIDAELSPEDKAYQEVLEGLGFARSAEEGKNGFVHYVYTKPQHPMLSLGISLGLCLGIPFGVALKNYGVGLPIGLAIGAAYGLLLDSREKRLRAEAETKRAVRGSDDEE